ncbi:YceI family protein [Ekhidna sp.]|uniref:YceI family protein n=1 Tax=Ekhidna sp. TaxID=2608089 RepID=UPI0032EDD7D0
MIRKIILLIFMLVCLSGFSQRFKTSDSFVKFFSDAPLEDIEADNESASSIIDVEKMAIVIVVPIKSFSFKKKLMQEHFNESYLESGKYPNATFKGKIEGWDGGNGSFQANAKGTMEIHGVTKEVTIDGELIFENNQIIINTVFPILLSDYEIKIPKAVFYNIAEEVEVTAKFQYDPYEKN